MKSRRDLITNAANESFKNGVYAYQCHNYIEAKTELSNAIRLNKALDITNADTYYYRGLVFFTQNNYEGAISDFKEALHCNQNAEKTCFYLGITYYKKGAFKEAITYLTASISIKPTPQAYNNRGNCHKKEGNNIDAINDYTQAIKLKPDHELYYHQRALANVAINDMDNAVRDETQAILAFQEPLQLQYANNKEAVLVHIKTLPKSLKILLLQNCLDPVTSLGNFFWTQRGPTAPNYVSGTLSEIIDLLKDASIDTDALIFSIQEKNYRPANIPGRFFPARQRQQPVMSPVCDDKIFAL